MAHYCKWDDHSRNLLTEVGNLKAAENYVDATIVCEGQAMKVHKLVLSTCSAFFHSMFQSNTCSHPIIIIQDMKFSTLQMIVNFIYRGEIAFQSNEVEMLLKAAQVLEITALNSICKEMFLGSSSDNINEQLQSNDGSMNDCSLDSSSPKKRRSEEVDPSDSEFTSAQTLNMTPSESLAEAEGGFNPQISEIHSFSETEASSTVPNDESTNFSAPSISYEDTSIQSNTNENSETNELTELQADSENHPDSEEQAVSIKILDKPANSSKTDDNTDFMAKKTSPVWNFFTFLNKNCAECNICPGKIRLSTNISNIKRHLLAKHNSIYLQHVQNNQNWKGPNTQNQSPKGASLTRKSRKRSLVWKYFTPVSETEAQCNTCKKSKSYGSTISNLGRHLRLKHPSLSMHVTKQKMNGDSLGKIKSAMQITKKKVILTITPKEHLNGANEVLMKKKRLNIWNYFIPINSSLAECKTCFVKRYYGTTVSNLQRHLKLKHSSLLRSALQEQVQEKSQESCEQIIPDGLKSVDLEQMDAETMQENLDDEEDVLEISSEAPSKKKILASNLLKKKTSYLWDFFTPINKKKAICNICSAVTQYQSSISNLKRHLVRAHPSVLSSDPTENVAEEAKAQNSTIEATSQNDDILQQNVAKEATRAQSSTIEATSQNEDVLQEGLGERNTHQSQDTIMEIPITGEGSYIPAIFEISAPTSEGVSNGTMQEVTLQILPSERYHQITGQTLQEIMIPTPEYQTEPTPSEPVILRFL